MIAVDPSALVAILREEPGYEIYVSRMAETGSVLGAPSFLELKMVLSKSAADNVDGLFERLKRTGHLTVIDFTPTMAAAAVDAFRRYGKGLGHPAKLNFGDCLSYAVARVRDVPLLFKGDDFALTDITPAIRS